jgi:hypothetical protein
MLISVFKDHNLPWYKKHGFVTYDMLDLSNDRRVGEIFGYLKPIIIKHIIYKILIQIF